MHAQRKYQNANSYTKKSPAYVRGNVAYNNNNFLDVQGNGLRKRRGIAKRPQEQIEAIPRVLNKKTKPCRTERKGLLSTLAVIFVGFCALALLVSRHAEIVKIGLKNNEITKEIGKLEERVENLETDIELRCTLESVQDIARTKLGMTYPLENQRMAVDLYGG